MKKVTAHVTSRWDNVKARGKTPVSLPPEQEEKITAFLQKVRFRKKIFGGVDEKDVWTKINELNDMYKEALIAECARFDALLAERRDAR